MPDDVRRLRELVGQASAGSPDQWFAEHASVQERLANRERRLIGAGRTAIPGLQWSLDPDLDPDRVLLPGLLPSADLAVHSDVSPDHIVVSAVRTPDASDDNLGRCRVRLVDPAARRVLATAAFQAEELGPWVRAEIRSPFPLDELGGMWIEVVADEDRPVRSEQLRHIRRALRAGDAAPRAEQCPHGLAPHFAAPDWSALAAQSWECCRRDWQDAGDADRAFLCAVRLAGAGSQACVPAAPSRRAAELVGRPGLREPAFLAEALGC